MLIKRNTILVAFSAFVLLINQGCSSNTEDTTTSTKASTQTANNALSLSPSNVSLTLGGTTTFFASGGTSPYTYTVLSGSGSINSSTGYYVAPSVAETGVIEVIDADGSVAYGYVTVFSSSTTSTSSLIPIYRFFSTAWGHFFSVSSTEGTSAGMTAEGIGFQVFSDSSVSGTQPIYRCVTSVGHFISLDSGCEGQTLEGTYGYIYSTNVSGSTALYRFASGMDHLITTSYAEGANAGYTYESTLGYVPN